MLAKPTPELPVGEGWRYEPKWDGFRALVFRDGPELYLQSRDLKPLDRYFPELLEPLSALGGPEARFVLDGEIVIARDGGLEFESLLLRIHPAASRVAMLAARRPARSSPSTAWRRATMTCARPRSTSGGAAGDAAGATRRHRSC